MITSIAGSVVLCSNGVAQPVRNIAINNNLIMVGDRLHHAA